MRLFGKVNGAIDRFDRAGWLTAPFDLAWAAARQLPTRALPDVTPLGPAGAARPRPVITPL